MVNVRGMVVGCVALSLIAGARPSSAAVAQATGKVIAASATPLGGTASIQLATGTLTVTTTAATSLSLTAGVHACLLASEQLGLMMGFVATVTFDTVTFVASDMTVDTLAIPPVPAITGNITVMNETTHQLSLTGGATFALPKVAVWRLATFKLAANYFQVGDPMTITYVVNGNGVKIAFFVRLVAKQQNFTGQLTSVNMVTGQIVVGGVTFIVDPNTSVLVFNANLVPLQSLQALANEIAVRPLTISVRYFVRPAGKIVVKI